MEENKEFLEEAICKNCEYYENGRCKNRPEKSLIDVETKEHTYVYEEVNENNHCSYFTKKDENINGMLYEAYLNIIDILKKYCDLSKDDYPIVATWIVGTYYHEQFESFPYLFLNAMKGSGKTRTLKLITDLSFEGEILLQPTEAVIFRTKGTLGIDESEGIIRKGMENLRELLNGCYKRGTKVKRMKNKKTINGTEQVVEEFNIYRPLALANINGMEDVLGDRCINIVLERSNNQGIIKLAEVWKDEKIFIDTKKLLNKCRKCMYDVPRKLYTDWNNYIYTTYITNTTYTTYTTYTELFKSLNLMDLTGREVELCLPLMFLAWKISEKVYENLHYSIKTYMEERKQEQFNESRDIMLIDMVSQETEISWISVKDIVRRFLEFTQFDNKDNEINPEWIGRALKRLKLTKEKRRVAGGTQVRLDLQKARDKIKQF